MNFGVAPSSSYSRMPMSHGATHHGTALLLAKRWMSRVDLRGESRSTIRSKCNESLTNALHPVRSHCSVLRWLEAVVSSVVGHTSALRFGSELLIQDLETGRVAYWRYASKAAKHKIFDKIFGGPYFVKLTCGSPTASSSWHGVPCLKRRPSMQLIIGRIGEKEIFCS